MTEKSDLEKLRNEIATVTFEILDLCKKRIELARKIAAVKLRMNLPIEDSKVERSLKQRVLDFCQKNSMHNDFCIDLFGLLIDESKRVQEEVMKSRLRGNLSKMED
ncbi:chorismate mutase [Candidatus Bathyarchaeota archaeon]|nr:chorismate mutase [Candidatus Bathyarchaeota archaeon]